MQTKQVQNPYSMAPELVRSFHFKDARLYDDQITESNWQIPRKAAIQKYRKWLRKVRREPGMENFNRRMCVIQKEEISHYDHNNNPVIVLVDVMIPFSHLNNNEVMEYSNGESVIREIWVEQGEKVVTLRKNKSKTVTAKSKVKGAGVMDTEYKAMFFTPKMGRYVSQLRFEKGMSREDLAKKMNLDVNMLARIESANNIPFNPEDPMVKLMAHHLGVPSIKYQE